MNKKFPFHTVLLDGYCAKIDIKETKFGYDVIINIPLGDLKSVIEFTNQFRGRHKFE